MYQNSFCWISSFFFITYTESLTPAECLFSGSKHAQVSVWLPLLLRMEPLVMAKIEVLSPQIRIWHPHLTSILVRFYLRGDDMPNSCIPVSSKAGLKSLLTCSTWDKLIVRFWSKCHVLPICCGCSVLSRCCRRCWLACRLPCRYFNLGFLFFWMTRNLGY